MNKISVENYFSYNNSLASGGQPTQEQLKVLKENGFEAIVNLSPTSARNALVDEAKVTESLQMNYVHFPVDCTNLQDFHYLTFKGIMNGLNGKKTFVHCGMNIKSSNLIHLYLVLEKGMNKTESEKILQSIQTPENKWIKYFAQMGIENKA